MCNAVCSDEAINRIHTEMCELSEFIVFPRRFAILHKSFIHVLIDFSQMYSRLPKACVSERTPEFSVPYSRFPVQSSEYLALPGLIGLIKESCPTDTPCREIETTCSELSLLVNPAMSNILRSVRHFRLRSCVMKKDGYWKSGCRKNIVSFMIVKKCNKLCHSSRLKVPFCWT